MVSIDLQTRIAAIKRSLDRNKGPHISLSAPNVRAIIRSAERSEALLAETNRLRKRLHKKTQEHEELKERMKSAKKLLQEKE